MRLFQNSGVYPSYRKLFDKRHGTRHGFGERLQAFLQDRFGAGHVLKPVLDGSADAFFTNGDDEILQKAWAREHGLPDTTSLADILLAQIEAHGTEVFYNADPLRYASDFVRRLPGSVKYALAWRAAPSPGADFEAYDRILCNFESILEGYRTRGWQTAYFAPAFDPAMAPYAARTNRPVDIVFVGGYSRHHKRRSRILEAAAKLSERRHVRFHLDASRLTRLAETPLGLLPRLKSHRRPPSIRNVSAAGVFGRDLYDAFGAAKIVLNCAIDMAGEDRGNMRCFEAMGCGAALVSDDGNYPDGMVPGETLITYRGPEDVAAVLDEALDRADETTSVAKTGYEMVKERYSKPRQWQDFQDIVGAIR